MSEARAAELLDAVVQPGLADEVEATLVARAGEYTRFAGDRIHQPQDITECQVMIRAVVDGHAGRAATSTLDRVPEAAARAAAIARALAAAAGRPGPARVGRPSEAPVLRLWHDDTAAFDAAARVAIARSAMAGARTVDGFAAGMIGRAVTQLAVATSSGIRRNAVATEATGSLTVTVADASAHWIDLHRSSDALAAPERIAATVRRAVAGRGRADLAPGTYTVVLGPEAVGELLGFLDMFGFSGPLAAAGVGICASRSGEQVASKVVNIADDALAPIGLPIPFDIEGTAKRVVPMFTSGVVGSPVTDLASADVLGVPPTGHAHIAREEAPNPVSANVVMSPGSATEDELIAGVEDGVYVERFWYTRLVDRQAGTITGVSRDGCFRIANGKLAQPLRGARFTQSVLDLLATVDGVATEQRSQPIMNVLNGATTAPAIRAHGFRFGAREAEPRRTGPARSDAP